MVFGDRDRTVVNSITTVLSYLNFKQLIYSIV